MSAAMKIILGELLAKQPDISIINLAITAVDDHIATKGCEFEDDAAVRAVEKSGIAPNTKAASVSQDALMGLGDILEDMETNCPDKANPNAPKCMPI